MGFAKDATHSTCAIFINMLKVKICLSHDTDYWFIESSPYHMQSVAGQRQTEREVVLLGEQVVLKPFGDCGRDYG